MNEVNTVIVDLSGEDKKERISAMDMFYTKKTDQDTDLVVLMTRDLTNYYCEMASKIFMSDAEIINVGPLNPISQRIIISKWFKGQLLIYRSRVVDIEVGTVLEHIIDEGSISDWLEQMQKVVIPFFKDKNVLNILEGE